MNQIIITGNTGKEHELKYSQSGTAILSFSVAVYEGKDKDGNSESQWFKVKAFKELAERVNGLLVAGSPVLVVGRAKQGSFTSKDGVKVNTFDVFASSITVYQKREKNDGQSESKTREQQISIPGEEEVF